jgi:hypothetical protein
MSTPLPAGHPQAGYIEADLSFTDGAGTLPPEELAWAENRDTAQETDAAIVVQAEHDVATAVREERLDTSGLRVASLIPTWCSIKDTELCLLHVMGSGFTDTTQIWWHDHLEPTVFVSENELTTNVTPWVFLATDFVEVGVQDGGVDGDQKLLFGLLP